LFAGAVKVNVAIPSPVEVAVPIVGACGTVIAVKEDEFSEAIDVPFVFVAVML
jgi:hypothetical protein